jgi:cytoskeleton protein RodZ
MAIMKSALPPAVDLRAARKRKGLSLERVAADTKIPRSLLEALERRDLSKFPPGIYARAYARTYATAVGLSPDDVLAALTDRLSGEESLQQIALAARPITRSKGVGRARLWRIALLLSIGAASLWAFGPRMSIPNGAHAEEPAQPPTHTIASPRDSEQQTHMAASPGPASESVAEEKRRPTAARRSSTQTTPTLPSTPVETTVESQSSEAPPVTEVLSARTLVTPMATDVPARTEDDLSAASAEQSPGTVGRAVRTFGRGLRKTVLRR